MALFDDVIRENYNDNFKGYVGNPPANASEYANFLGWKDKTTAPTWAVVKAKMDDLAILQKRAKEYPSMQSQLDMLWHAIDSDSLDKNSDFYQTIKQVKDSNPKAGA